MVNPLMSASMQCMDLLYLTCCQRQFRMQAWMVWKVL